MKKLIAAVFVTLFAVVFLASMQTVRASSDIALTVMNAGTEAIPAMDIKIDDNDSVVRPQMRGKVFSFTPSSDGIVVFDMKCVLFKDQSVAEIDNSMDLTDPVQLVTLNDDEFKEAKLMLDAKTGTTYYFALYSKSPGSSFSVKAALYPYGGKQLPVDKSCCVALGPNSNSFEYTFTATKTGCVDISLAQTDLEGYSYSKITAYVYRGGKKLSTNKKCSDFITYCGVEKGKTYTLRLYVDACKNKRVPIIANINIGTAKVSTGSTTKKAAHILNKGVKYSGFLLGRGDTRWYKLKLTKTQKVNIHCCSYSNNKSQDITIYKGVRKLNLKNSSVDDGEIYYDHIYKSTLKKGTYYIRFKNGGEASGRYCISWK